MNLKEGKHQLTIPLAEDSLSNIVSVPTLIIKGKKGPTIGVIAALHGNELNGIRVVQELFKNLDTSLQGTFIGIPIVNVPAFLRRKRLFSDNVDLNHIFPGKEDGEESDQFAFQLYSTLLRHCDYLIDIHTADYGRENTFHVRADLKKKQLKQLAPLLNPVLILNSTGGKATLRNYANRQGIHTMTIELGRPQQFQEDLISSCTAGILNLLKHLKMMPGKATHPKPLVVNKSQWMYSTEGGLLEIFAELGKKVKKGQIVASLKDHEGNVKKIYKAPYDGIVIGKKTDPVISSGGRIIHLGHLDG